MFSKKQKTGEFLHTTEGTIYLSDYKSIENLGHGKVLLDRGLPTEKTCQITYDNAPSPVKRGLFKRLFRMK